jgi:hypothetical protein
LNAMKNVEDDHARVDLDLERLELATRVVPTPDFESSLRHGCS